MLSIIIPVYNVQEYIEKCLDSVLSQSFKEIEIILVDDGSTDNSGKICDEYAKLDNRIKVIHKSNGGQSSARNAGIKIATGKFITFIDSDDYIADQDTYLNIIKTFKTLDVDIIQFPFRKELKNGKFEYFKIENNLILKLPKEKLENLIFIHSGNLTCMACDKVFKKEVFNNILFYEKIDYEDFYFIGDIIFSKYKIGFTNQGMYSYVMRENSIMNSKLTERKYLDKIFVVNRLYCLTKQYINDSFKEQTIYFFRIIRLCIYAKIDYPCFKLPHYILYKDFIPMKIEGTIYENIKYIVIKLLGVRTFVDLLSFFLRFKR